MTTAIRPRSGASRSTAACFTRPRSGARRRSSCRPICRASASPREALLWDRAELRMGASDARGLTTGGTLIADGKRSWSSRAKVRRATGGQGFFAFLPWDGEGALAVDYAFGLRGSRSLSLVPRGGQTRWTVARAGPAPASAAPSCPKSRDLDAGFQGQLHGRQARPRAAAGRHRGSGPPLIDDGDRADYSAATPPVSRRRRRQDDRRARPTRSPSG